MPPGFGTDGIRGLANDGLTPEVALALGRAAVEVLDADLFVIGRDPRRSGPMLEAALLAGICAAGADVELLGVVPTPAVAWAAADRPAAGAMISASHNPFADNGIKLFARGGLKLADELEAEIETRYREVLAIETIAGPTGAGVGAVVAGTGVGGWVSSLQDSIVPRRLDGLTVVADCANGAASGVARSVYEGLGATVHLIGDRPDGLNINDGYGSTAPHRLMDAVTELGADIGLAFDGDGDRLIAVDETGAVVDGDRMLAILATDWSERGLLAANTVVVTVMTNLGFHRAMRTAGIEVLTTAVGDRHVLALLDERGLSLGGEQSGHIICRELATTGDGLLTGVQLADAVLRSGRPLSKWAAEALTTVPQILRNVELPHADDTIIERMGNQIRAVEDELGQDGRVLVRASGTEPVLRIMVEHLDPGVAEGSCDRLVAEARLLATGSGPHEPEA